jgi:hypothetical protein
MKRLTVLFGHMSGNARSISNQDFLMKRGVCLKVNDGAMAMKRPFKGPLKTPIYLAEAQAGGLHGALGLGSNKHDLLVHISETLAERCAELDKFFELQSSSRACGNGPLIKSSTHRNADYLVSLPKTSPARVLINRGSADHGASDVRYAPGSGAKADIGGLPHCANTRHPSCH